MPIEVEADTGWLNWGNNNWRRTFRVTVTPSEMELQALTDHLEMTADWPLEVFSMLFSDEGHTLSVYAREV